MKRHIKRSICIVVCLVALVGTSATSVSSASSSSLSGDFILGKQAAKGFWGDKGKEFITTVAVLDALNTLGDITNKNYEGGVSYIDYYISDNNDYYSKQVSVLNRAREYITDDSERLAYSVLEESGGVSFDRGYYPDPLTTASVLQTLTEVDYQDSSVNKKVTISLMLYYLANSQNQDGGWTPVSGGKPTTLATAQVLESLLAYKGMKIQNLGGKDIYIDYVIQRALSFLSNGQGQDGLWDKDLASTLYAFPLIKKTAYPILYEETLRTKIKELQGPDGSYGEGDVFLTALAIPTLKLIGE